MKDKRSRHGAVGKLSLEQHFHKCAAITFISGALHLGSYGGLAGRQIKSS